MLPAVVELFTCVVDDIWMVGWQQFDEYGDLVGEGRVSRTASRTPHETLRSLYTMSLDLRISHIRFDPVAKGVLRVEARPSQIARATERRLGPVDDGKQLRRT